MPVATALTFWPLQFAFLAARPGLERLADQVKAGVSIAYPRRVGIFHILGSRLDQATGNVALLTDTSPGGPAGFVRNRAGRPSPYGCFSPIRGDADHVSLWGGWCFHVED
jgi:hypothetical protein